MRRTIEDWIESKRSCGRWSRNTAHSVRKWGLRFACFLKDHCQITNARHITREHIDRYRESRLQFLAKSSQSCERDYLRSFFAWCVEHDILLSSPVAHLAPITIPPTVRTALSVKEVDNVLAAVDTSTLGGIHDRAVVETLYATAIRRAELIALNLADIDIAARKIWVRHGKGDKSRILPITAAAFFWLHLYLTDVRAKIIKDPACPSLFLGRSGRRLTCAHLSRLMKRLRRLTGLAHLTPHALRHTCATHLMDAGVPLLDIQKFLGHDRLVTTQKYLHLSIATLKSECDLAHPREHWSLLPKEKKSCKTSPPTLQ